MSQQTRIDQFYKMQSTKTGKNSEMIGSRRSLNQRKSGKQKHTGESPSFLLGDSLLPDCLNQGKNVQSKRENMFSKTEDNIDEEKQSMETSASDDTSGSIVTIVPEIWEQTTTDSQRLLMKNLKNNIDYSLLVKTIEQLNLSMNGAIPSNNFDLEKIYTKDVYEYEYNDMIAIGTLGKYKLEEVHIPKSDIYAKLAFSIIINVFSSPLNCGYFEKDELDFVFSILTLPEEPLMLLVRMLKRQRNWFRKSNLNYPEIGADLKIVLDILVSYSICTFDIDCKEEMESLLELLQVDEMCKLCRLLKIESTGRKEKKIERLKRFAKSKPLFSNEASQVYRLYSLVLKLIGYCVALTKRTKNIFDRIITLLIPGENPEASISDTFSLLFRIYENKVTFPCTPMDQFPVFSSRHDLIKYVEAKRTYMKLMNHKEKKDWKEMQQLGRLARDHLQYLIPFETARLKNSTLPMHVRRFMPGYMWMKVLSKSVAAYKKIVEDKAEAVEILQLLITQNCHMQNKKGKWYNELALIEMHDHKNLSGTANIILEAMKLKDINIVDRMDLLERASKIMKKKTGSVKLETKRKMSSLVDSWITEIPCMADFSVASVEIEAFSIQGNAGYKRKWCIDIGAEGGSYGSVETLAMYHYRAKGYPNGLHCEGSLPIALFSVLFWEELYTVSVPGAHLSVYQAAPQDLFTDEFYKNRKELIDIKLESLQNLDIDTLSTMMQETYMKCCDYDSIVPLHLFMNEYSQLKEVVRCLGVESVLGICRQLLNNYQIWKAGFPDLIVWDSKAFKYKIVEVKGPMDTLSTKQKLWLHYLGRLGVVTEICYVRSEYQKVCVTGEDS